MENSFSECNKTDEETYKKKEARGQSTVDCGGKVRIGYIRCNLAHIS